MCLVGSNYLLTGIKGSGTIKYLVANTGGPVTGHFQINVKQNSRWSKALIMPLTSWNFVLSYK